MYNCKDGRISKEPPEAHNAQRWFWFIVKTFFLYRNADEQYAYESQKHTSGCMQARSIVKSVDGDTQQERQHKEQDIRHFERKQQDKKDIKIWSRQVVQVDILQQENLDEHHYYETQQVNYYGSTHLFSAEPPVPLVL